MALDMPGGDNKRVATTCPGSLPFKKVISRGPTAAASKTPPTGNFITKSAHKDGAFVTLLFSCNGAHTYVVLPFAHEDGSSIAKSDKNWM